MTNGPSADTNPNSAGNSNKTEQKPFNAYWILLVFCVLVAAFTVPPCLISTTGEVWMQLIPLGVLILIALILGIAIHRMSRTAETSRKEEGHAESTLHLNIQLLILVITFASFYAFGWPKKMDAAHLTVAFSELSVILVLFLLSELAAYLTLGSERIARQLKHTGTEVNQEVQKAANDAVQGITSATTPVIAELRSIKEKIDPEKFHKSVEALEATSRVMESVKVISDAATKEMVLDRIGAYTQAWAAVLQRVH